jgi:hypothetical protein
MELSGYVWLTMVSGYSVWNWVDMCGSRWCLGKCVGFNKFIVSLCNCQFYKKSDSWGFSVSWFGSSQTSVLGGSVTSLGTWLNGLTQVPNTRLQNVHNLMGVKFTVQLKERSVIIFSVWRSPPQFISLIVLWISNQSDIFVYWSVLDCEISECFMACDWSVW